MQGNNTLELFKAEEESIVIMELSEDNMNDFH